MEKEKYIISFSESDGISNLDTYPQMTADALKRQFDQKSDKLKDAHNALVEGVADEFEAEAEARDEALKLKADAQTERGGFVAGQNAVAESSGVAIGGNAKSTGTGAALGVNAESRFGGAVGGAAKTNDGGAVGRGSVSGDGFAGGSLAKAVDSDGNGIDAIQLGTGTNNKEKTLQIYDRTIVEYDGSGRDSAEKWYLSDVGKLADLQTSEKTDIVGAINEVVSSMGDVGTALDGILALQASYIGGESE